MSSFPTSPRSALLMWAQAHAPVWSANALAIGLTPAQATNYTTAVNAYDAAALAQEQAKQVAMVATEHAADTFGGLRASTGDMVRTIRAFAENQSKPLTVYNLAQIPPPAVPSPAPPPAQPTELSAALDSSTGELMLRWKATNPVGGTSYIIRRKLPGEGEFAFVGVTGTKRFTDDTFFAGPDSVQYTVQGQRADAAGPVSEVFTVNFGRAPGGGFNIASAFEGTGGAGGAGGGELRAAA